jgi:Rod binding domain-containing protein
MTLIEPSKYNSVMPDNVINADQQVFNRIKDSSSGKEQLKKVAKEFESIFISKMFSLLDKTVDREGGILGNETKYFDNLKSYMYNEMGRELANKPSSSFGFAKQIYEQMEKYVAD